MLFRLQYFVNVFFSARSFVLRNLEPQLRPQKIEKLKEDSGPFLFTPIHFGSLERKNVVTSSKMGTFYILARFCNGLKWLSISVTKNNLKLNSMVYKFLLCICTILTSLLHCLQLWVYSGLHRGTKNRHVCIYCQWCRNKDECVLKQDSEKIWTYEREMEKIT